MQQSEVLQYSKRGLEFDYMFDRRKGRKHVSLKVDACNTVRVLLPWTCAVKHVPRVIKDHLEWIEKQLHKNQTRGLYQAKSFSDGETFFVMGKAYELVLNMSVNKRCSTPKIDPMTCEIRVDVPRHLNEDAAIKEYVSKKVVQCYKKYALEYFQQRTLFWGRQWNLRPHQIKVQTAKMRWGSCSTKGVINYNWKLWMAPEDMIDYVIVHELCHLKHPNHSKNFWNMLAEIMPDYLTRKHWLRDNGHVLELF